MKSVGIIYGLVHLVLLCLGLFLATSENALIFSIGSSIVAAAIAGYVVWIYIYATQKTADRLECVQKFGIASIFEKRASAIKDEYDKRLHRAQRNIDILGFGLRALREDYRNEMPKWASKAPVRLLLIDPEFPEGQSFADQRDDEEGNPQSTIATEVRQFLVSVGPIVRESRGRFKIRLYRCLPTVSIFRVDDQIFWGPYLVKRQGRNSPTLVVERGPLFEVMLDHFQSVWESPKLSREVPQDWFTNAS